MPRLSKLAYKLRKLTRKTSARDVLLASLPRHTIGAEIGVHKGDFSWRLIEAVRPKQLLLIDPWQYQADDVYKNSWYGGQLGEDQAQMDSRYQTVCERFSEQIAAGQVRVIRSESEKALSQLDDESLDWIYIDGNHLYEYVRRDLELAYSKVRSGGFISGDDYTSGGWWQGGVKKAVDEFVNDRKAREVRIIGGQFLITKP